MIYVWLLQIVLNLFIFRGEAVVHFRRKMTMGGVSFKKTLTSTRNATEEHYEDFSYGYEVDVLLVADYSVYEGFFEIANGDEYSAEAATNIYLNAIFEQMRLIVAANPIFHNEKLSLNLVKSFVVIRPEDCPIQSSFDAVLNETTFDNSTNMERNVMALDAIHMVEKWVEYYAEWLPKHDHATVITKYDLQAKKGDSSTQGMAFVGCICKSGKSVSVVEDVGGMTTAVVATHELVHCLGAVHDGEGTTSTCKVGFNHLMAPLASGSDDEPKFTNSFKLSSCSIKQIEDFLLNETAACLRVHKSKDRRLRRTSSPEERTKPGEMISKDKQCKIAFGPHYGICRQKSYGEGMDACKRLWCKNRKQKWFEPCESKSFLPLLDGTECGPNKWCISGKCTVSGKEKKGCVDANSSVCTSFSKKRLKYFCKSDRFIAICCFTCSLLKLKTA